MDQGSQFAQDAAASAAHGKEAVGYMIDTALAGGAVAAWLLSIEQLIGPIIAAVVAIGAVVTAIYRAMYWRERYKRERDSGVRE